MINFKQMLKKSKEPILPCPYCGGQPILKIVGDNKEYVVYVCSNCYETPVHIDEARCTLSGAKRIWNKRVKEMRGTKDDI